MKRWILGVAFAAIATTAFADPMMNWTGFYAGGLLTYGDGNAKHCDSSAPCTGAPGTDAPISFNGWMGGVTLGYNWQVTNWVLGVEGDWSWGHIDARTPAVVNGFGCSGACTTDIKSLGTIRGRIGYAFNNFLPYLTAGVGFSDIHASLGTSEGSAVKPSFVWGGGLEYAFASQWTMKIEYLRVEDAGDVHYDKVQTCGPPSGCYLHDAHYDTVRLGLNYRFGSH